jgi:Ca2+-binding RTX toxin-like protein
VLEFVTGDGEDSLIARQGPQEVDVDPGAGEDRVVVNSTNDDEQSLIMGVGDTVFALADPFVTVHGAEPTDRLRLNGRGGDDLLSTSTAAMRITLSAGDGGGTLLGGPGDDVLLGGDDFDLVEGNEGDDTIDLGGDLDSTTWRAGDGEDRVDGGGGARNGMFIFGSDADETFDFAARGKELRVSGAAALDIKGIQAFDVLPGSGADVTRIGDLRSAGVTDIHASLAATIITAGGDTSADRVELAGAKRAATVTGQGGAATVAGLPVRLQLTHSDGPGDTLAIRGAASVDRSGLPDGVIGLEIG